MKETMRTKANQSASFDRAELIELRQVQDFFDEQQGGSIAFLLRSGSPEEVTATPLYHPDMELINDPEAFGLIVCDRVPLSRGETEVFGVGLHQWGMGMGQVLRSRVARRVLVEPDLEIAAFIHLLSDQAAEVTLARDKDEDGEHFGWKVKHMWIPLVAS